MTMTIRDMIEPDIAQCAKLLKEEWLLHAEQTKSYSRAKIEARDINDWLLNRVIKTQELGVLVADAEGTIAGLCLYCVSNTGSITTHQHLLRIEDIFTAAEFRRQGVAESLLAAIENKALSLHCTAVAGDIYDFNDQSRQFMTANGYRPEYTSYMKDLNTNQIPGSSPKLDTAKLYADGGSRGNPGPSAGGFVIYDMQNNVVEKSGKFLGVTTNNQAEYHALKGGVESARAMGVRQLHVYMDSLLVINQMKGIYKVKNRDLWPIHDAIKQLLPSFESVNFSHVPRELNKAADAMVNQTLDDIERNRPNSTEE